MVHRPSQSEQLGNDAIAADRRRLVATAALLALITLAAYWPSLSAGFVTLDDYQYIIDNEFVREGGMSAIGKFFREVRHPSTVDGYYQPLTMVSYMIDARFAGESGLDPFPYHLANILWHAGTAILVMFLARFVVGGVAVPLLIGVFFAIHPMQVESVSWISQRKTVLASFFAVASVLAYLHYGQSKRRGLLIASLLLYCVAGLAKPTVMLLPLVLPMLDFWPLRRPVMRRLFEKLPHFAVMLLMAWVAWVSQASSAALMRPSFNSVELVASWIGLLSFNLMQYLGNVFVPLWLSPYRDVPSSLSFTNPQVFLSVIGTAAVIAVLLVSIRNSRPLFVGMAAFAIILLPALGGVRFTGSCVADRFLYLPFAFLLLPLAALCHHILAKQPRREPMMIRVLALLAALMFLLMIPQQRVWSDSKSLWSHVAAAVPNNAKAHNNLAFEALQDEDFDEALRQLDFVLHDNPNDPDALHIRGMILSRQGKPEEGLRLIDLAIKLGLGSTERAAHQARAEALLILGDDPAAEAALQTAINMGRTPFVAYKDMADVALRFAKRYDVAEVYCHLALHERPDALAIRWNLGTALRYLRRNDEALREYEAVVSETQKRDLEPPEFMLTEIGNLRSAIAQSTTQPGTGSTR